MPVRGTDTDHFVLAETSLDSAKDHIAKIDRAARGGKCDVVIRELVNSWGFIRAAEAQLTGLEGYDSKRARRADRKINMLKNRWHDRYESYGFQCTRK
jgi:hypothetical protein